MTERIGGSSDCIFCRIIAGTEPGEVVWDDEVAVGILDRRPLFHGHTLVVPRRHVVTLADLDPTEVGPFFLRVQAISAAMPEALGCTGTFVANNNIVSQSVAHLHVHVVPRVKGDGLRGFFWPRTTYTQDELERCGTRLREAFAGIPVAGCGSSEPC
ncbi:HIT family protein [Ilumatobacter sp.]|uniref:HIT family protein n=1 Tax=Ilumatobacter sp. TaxID=1967498 RepID=UPI003C47F57F